MFSNLIYLADVGLHPFQTFKDNFMEGLWSILLHISGAIYSFVNYVYQIFLVLATGNSIFDDSVIQGLVNRVYVIVGVIVLFLVAYSLLKAMINPDETFKGKQSPTKMIVNVIVSVILIAFIPTIFDFAFSLQNSLLLNNTIGKLLLGTSGQSANETIQQGGYTMASESLKAFLIVQDGNCDVEDEQRDSDGNLLWADDNDNDITEGIDGCAVMYVDDNNTTSYARLWEDISSTGKFYELANVAGLIVEGKITYIPILDWIAGIFLLLVLIQYCFEMAVRLVKLSLYEMIAPLPILCRIIPSPQVEKIFNNWVKETVATFADVFIRIAILFFCVMMISAISTSVDNIFSAFSSTGLTAPLVKTIAMMLLILGIIEFCRRAPQIIKDLTGFDGGKYNPLNSAKQAIAFIGGTAAGAASGDVMSGVTGGYRAYNETGRTGNLQSIGNQYAQGRSLKVAKEQGSTFKGRAANGVRRAFGLGSTKQVADERLQNNMDINGNPFEVTNESSVIIPNGTAAYDPATGHYGTYDPATGKYSGDLVDVGGTLNMDENTVAYLHEKEAQNQLAISESNRKIATYSGYKKGNDIYVDAKKELEDIAKSEMAKGKYTLKNESGQNLTVTYTKIDPATGKPIEKQGSILDQNGKPISAGYETATVGVSKDEQGNEVGWTQKQWHDWFEANRNNLSADDVADISKKISESENKHTVKAFIDNNGVEQGKNVNDQNEWNEELIAAKEKLYANINMGASVRDTKGEIDKEFSTIANDIKSKKAKDITYDNLGDMKDIAITQDTAINSEIQTEGFHQKSYDSQNQAIKDLFTEVEEQKKQAQNSDAYRALQADEAASRINPPQGK